MIARRVILTLLIFLQNFILFAQSDLPVTRKTFKTDVNEGFTEAWENLLEGEKLFNEGIGTYDQAREYYLKAHQYNSDHPALNLKIGICYLNTDNKYEALKYILKAYDLAPKLCGEMHYFLGRAYHHAHEFDKAIEHYSEYKKNTDKNANSIPSDQIDKLISECINGKKVIENPKRVLITNLGQDVNSPYDDYSPVLSNNDSLLYFTSRRPLAGNKKRNPFDNKYYENIYVSRFIDNEWKPATLLFEKPKKSLTEAVVGVSPDFKTIYIYIGGKNGGDVYQSIQKKGKWQKPKPIDANLRSKEADGSVFLTSGADSIFLVSASEKLTRGGKDLLLAVKNLKGKWLKPVNAGSIINTIFEEEGVFLTSNSNEIYFSSKGHNSMGGYDIFHSVKNEDGLWSDPENIGFPINTPDDDLFFSLSPDGKYGYYSTIREGSVGAKDIYKITFLGTEKELLLSTEDIELSGIPVSKKRGFFTMPSPVEIDTFYYLTGKVLDKKSNEPVLSRLEFIDIEASRIIANSMTDSTGNYRVKFSQAKNYGVEIKAVDYLFFLDAVNMTGASTDEPFVKDFYIEKIEIGAKVILENIYFETNKSTLTPASYTQLNQVIEFMKSNPTLRLEISGHTDNVGSLKVNTKLSQDRAKAVVDYIVGNGINSGRLEWKGYAFTQPVALNDTPEGREKNRRVEFKVIGK